MEQVEDIEIQEMQMLVVELVVLDTLLELLLQLDQEHLEPFLHKFLLVFKVIQ